MSLPLPHQPLPGPIPGCCGRSPLRSLALVGLLALLPATVLAPPVQAQPPGGGSDKGADGTPATPQPASGPVVYPGLCRPSTALAFGNGLVVVAEPAGTPPGTLRLFRSGEGGEPLAMGHIPAAAWDPRGEGLPQPELEAAARIGPLAYWIGSSGSSGRAGASNGATSNGGGAAERRPQGLKLFATTLGIATPAGGKGLGLTLDPIGRPYASLVDDLAADPRYAVFDLPAAAARPGATSGLRIGGMVATPSGALLVAFRQPITKGKALLAPLSNPNAVLAGEPARFGDPVQLDLAGLGIRSLAMVDGSLYILAGPGEGQKPGGANGSPAVFYRWNGQFESGAVRLRSSAAAPGPLLSPAQVLVRMDDHLLLLSEEGASPLDGTHCGQRPAEKQRVRELRLPLSSLTP
ncbi:MAG: DUF3616 domain-containing protein [Cyanobium sp. ELA507]